LFLCFKRETEKYLLIRYILLAYRVRNKNEEEYIYEFQSEDNTGKNIVNGSKYHHFCQPFIFSSQLFYNGKQNRTTGKK
jgi:hypothetical protein